MPRLAIVVRPDADTRRSADHRNRRFIARSMRQNPADPSSADGRCRAAPASAAGRRSRLCTPTVSPAASGGACWTASKFTSADSYSSVVCSRFTCASSRSRCACVTRNVVDSPTSKRRCSDCEALLRERRARARGLHAFGRAVDLPARPAHRLGRLHAQARDPLRRLPPLDVGARKARGLEAAAERIAHRQAEAPRRVVVGEHLAERVAETAAARAGDESRESAAAQELRAAEAVAAVRRFEPHVGQPLVVEEVDRRPRILQLVARAREVVPLAERLRDRRVHIGKRPQPPSAPRPDRSAPPERRRRPDRRSAGAARPRRPRPRCWRESGSRAAARPRLRPARDRAAESARRRRAPCSRARAPAPARATAAAPRRSRASPSASSTPA